MKDDGRMSRSWRVLVVDDERIVRETMAAWLREDGYAVDAAENGDAAVALAKDNAYAVCFLDRKLPGSMDGIRTMLAIRAVRPETVAVIITAYATVDTAIAAMKEGAQEYIVKPCNPQEISLIVERVTRLKRLERANLVLRNRLLRRYEFRDIVSKSARMAEVFDLVRDVAGLRSTVLVQGESGTGKETIARAIHAEGGAPERPFVAVPCVALAESLLESELFGHEKGAFTGAVERRRGKIELAAGGTLFLGEIGDISPRLQMDLLRFLQERTFYRVGGTEEIAVDVRVIAATHQDLREGVRRGTFREDLFYRLNVIDIRLPPLRERREDIPLLARHFIERLAPETGKDVTDLDDSALARLMEHDWPGNVRELENAIERAIVTARSPVLSADSFRFLQAPVVDPRPGTFPGGQSLAQIEAEAIRATLANTGGNVKRAAAILGIDRSTLHDKLKRFGIARNGTGTEE